MHQNTPFQGTKFKHFLGRGHCPTPSPHPTPVVPLALGSSVEKILDPQLDSNMIPHTHNASPTEQKRGLQRFPAAVKVYLLFYLCAIFSAANTTGT